MGVIEAVAEVIEPIIAEEGLSLWAVEWTHDLGRRVLRVMVERDAGAVSVEDCSRLSHSIEDIIEVKELIPTRYDLEVSSPGLERPLQHDWHFKRSIGQSAQVRTKVPLGDRRNYKGRITQAREKDFVIEIDGKPHEIAYDNVDKAHLVYELKTGIKKKN